MKFQSCKHYNCFYTRIASTSWNNYRWRKIVNIGLIHETHSWKTILNLLHSHKRERITLQITNTQHTLHCTQWTFISSESGTVLRPNKAHTLKKVISANKQHQQISETNEHQSTIYSQPSPTRYSTVNPQHTNRNTSINTRPSTNSNQQTGYQS